MKNWWYYHKWYVILGVVLLGITVYLTGNALGWFKKSPDIQIAYIGETPLPSDTISALECAFGTLADDYNQDGEIIIQIHTFASGNPQNTDADSAYYRQASEIALIGDINDCESYFFLIENPDEFQKNYQVLAMPDGSCPKTSDFSIQDKVFQWGSCTILSEMDLGSYTTTILGQTVSGSNQELLAPLFLGRRCFYNEKQCDNAPLCSQLWDRLKGDFDYE